MTENNHELEVPEGTYDDNEIYELPRDYILPDKVFKLLDPVTKVIIPGFGALYYTLAGAWNLPNADPVVATCAAVATFLGLFLVFAQRSYDNSQAKYDGGVYLTEGETMDGRRMKDVQFGISQALDAGALEKKKSITLKVVNQ